MNKDRQQFKLAEFYVGGKLAYGMAMLPNYLSDLNAIHDIEKKLNFSQRQTYYYQLQLVLSRNIVLKQDLLAGVLVAMEACIMASAEQRAEALLKALDLWETE